jgi:hypothetical protein
MIVPRGFAIAVTAVLLIAIFWCGRCTGLALEFKESLERNPRHGTEVSSRGLKMEWDDFILGHVVPKELGGGWAWLIGESKGTLWNAFYAFSGMAGAIAGIWFALRTKRRIPLAEVALSVLIGGFLGFVVCLLLRMPGAAHFFRVSVGDTPLGVATGYHQYTVLAVLAGLFANEFYEILRKRVNEWGGSEK